MGDTNADKPGATPDEQAVILRGLRAVMPALAERVDADLVAILIDRLPAAFAAALAEARAIGTQPSAGVLAYETGTERIYMLVDVTGAMEEIAAAWKGR